MFALKPISSDSLGGALAKAERYRLLHEPEEAESICRDILAVAPGSREALVTLILALTDQIGHDPNAFKRAIDMIDYLQTPYDRAYYTGIAWERRAKARHRGSGQGANSYVYDWILKAMDLFEQAEPLRPPENDDARLRWNACVRYLDHHRDLTPAKEEVPETILLE
jgi:hypothetical protein